MDKNIDIIQKELIENIDKVSHIIPCIIVIHEAKNRKVIYMSQSGLDIIGVTSNMLMKLEKTYFNNFFNKDDVRLVFPKFKTLIKGNSKNECVSYFQRVRSNSNTAWIWNLSNTKVLLKENNAPSLLITILQPINFLDGLVNGLDKLIANDI